MAPKGTDDSGGSESPESEKARRERFKGYSPGERVPDEGGSEAQKKEEKDGHTGGSEAQKKEEKDGHTGGPEARTEKSEAWTERPESRTVRVESRRGQETRIMKMSNCNYIADITPHLEKKYGVEKAREIISLAIVYHGNICARNSGEPKSYDMHTKERIYPAVACLQAMTESGIERQEAINFLHDYYLWRAEGKAKKLRKVMKIPGLYRLVPKLFKKLTPKMFGDDAGFHSQWHDDPEWELSFDMVKCPYLDKCKEYGCPELCAAFCDADDVCYANLHPKLKWGRTKTLGKGGECCDFRMKPIR